MQVLRFAVFLNHRHKTEVQTVPFLPLVSTHCVQNTVELRIEQITFWKICAFFVHLSSAMLSSKVFPVLSATVASSSNEIWRP